jgi:hypothetical protein
MHTLFCKFAKDLYNHWRGTWRCENRTDDSVIPDNTQKDIGDELYQARKTTQHHRYAVAHQGISEKHQDIGKQKNGKTEWCAGRYLYYMDVCPKNS